MKKILVTGGAGYIGSVLVPELLRNEYEVTVIDNFMFNQSSLSECCYNKNFNIINGDVRDELLIKEVVKDHDIFIPLAALVGAPLCDKDKIGCETTNRDAVKLLTSKLSKDQRIIIPITNSGYGIGEKGKYCTEETPLRPISFYGTTKVDAEKAAFDHGNTISLRLATVFGMSPRMRLDLLVNDFTYRAVKDKVLVVFEGHFKRNYIHIRDVVRAFLFAIDDKLNVNEAYNVGLSDANLSKIELCNKIKEIIPEFIFLEEQIGKDPDKRDYIVSNDKIEKMGFMPAYSLEDGIHELVKGYKIINNNKYSNI